MLPAAIATSTCITRPQPLSLLASCPCPCPACLPVLSTSTHAPAGCPAPDPWWPLLSADNVECLMSWCKKQFAGRDEELNNFFKEVRMEGS